MSDASEPMERNGIVAAGTEPLHAVLRRITRPLHDGVEQLFEGFDLASHDGLGQFLLRQAAAVLPLERALDTAGAGSLLADWGERRRAAALLRDLALLGLEAQAVTASLRFDTAPEVLGALYVLEGSKLGGRVLSRRALRSSDPRVRAACAFLGHRGGSGWPAFLAVLDAWPIGPRTLAQVANGAAQAFAFFHSAAADTSGSTSALRSTRSHDLQPSHA